MVERGRPEPVGRQSAVRYRSPALRSVRTTGWNLAFACSSDVWVTVELSDRYRVQGRSSRGRIDRTGSIGAVHVTPPNETLEVELCGDYRAVQLAIPAAAAAAIAAEDHGVGGTAIRFEPVFGASDPRLARLVCSLAACTEQEQERAGTREVVAHLTEHYSSASAFRSTRARGGISSARLRRVFELVNADLAEVTVDAMAAEAELSPYHFAREFRRATGLSPWSAVLSRRLARAIDLMRGSRRPLAEIAQRSGFADSSHLAHRMKQRFGCSPTVIRSLLLS